MSLVSDNLSWNAKNLAVLQAESAAHHVASLHHFQEQGLERFLKSDFPTRQDEDWKYTPLQVMQAHTYVMPKKPQKTEIVLPEIMPEAIRLIFVDGRFSPEASQLSELPSGLLVTSILDPRHQKDLSQLLSLNEEYATPFSDLNAALMGEGIFIRVLKGVEVTRPLHLVYYSSTEAASLMSHPRHLIVLEAESKLNLIEEYKGSASTYFNNVVMRIVTGRESRLTLYKLQEEGEHAVHMANTVMTQHENSHIRYFTLSLGAQLSRDNLAVDLQAGGVECELYGLYLPKNTQLIDHHTRIDHRVSYGTSTQSYKGIIADKARGVFNGKVRVSPDAIKTAASQSNKNLLLSSFAEIDTKPELEIYADDVKCTHGATVGQLDQQALFYLQSRGLSADLAQHMLMQAFSEEIFAHCPDQAIAKYFQKRVACHLEGVSCLA